MNLCLPKTEIKCKVIAARFGFQLLFAFFCRDEKKADSELISVTFLKIIFHALQFSPMICGNFRAVLQSARGQKILTNWIQNYLSLLSRFPCLWLKQIKCVPSAFPVHRIKWNWVISLCYKKVEYGKKTRLKTYKGAAYDQIRHVIEPAKNTWNGNWL